MRRCIIHIGHAKAASTYLQHCLHLNAELFARHNYWVPSDFTDLGFYDLVALSQQNAAISGNLAPMHVLLTEGPGALIPRTENYVFGAPGMSGDCDVLLSSELFFYYWPSTLQMAISAGRFGLTPEVVVYVARQDGAAISAYLQNVRRHGFTQGVMDFLLHDRNVPYCHYMRILQRMLDKMPGLRITVRSFESRFLISGDILTDFLAAIDAGVDATACVRPARTSNQGLLLEQYELLRAATILGRADAAAQLDAAEVSLTQADRDRIHAYYYRPWVQDFLTGTYLEGNHAMVEQFMPGASVAERSYWRNFDPAGEAATLDREVFERLRLRAFG